MRPMFRDDHRILSYITNTPIYEGMNNSRLIDYDPYLINDPIASQLTWRGLDKHVIFQKSEYDYFKPHSGDYQDYYQDHINEFQYTIILSV